MPRMTVVMLTLYSACRRSNWFTPRLWILRSFHTHLSKHEWREIWRRTADTAVHDQLHQRTSHCHRVWSQKSKSVLILPSNSVGHMWALIKSCVRWIIARTALLKKYSVVFLVTQLFLQLTGLVCLILLLVIWFTHCAEISLYVRFIIPNRVRGSEDNAIVPVYLFIGLYAG